MHCLLPYQAVSITSITDHTDLEIPGPYCKRYNKTNSLAEPYQSIELDNSLTGSEQFNEFKKAAEKGNLVPIYERLFSDQLTPIAAYRCLVGQDDHELPSFLYESVVNGDQTVSILSLLLS